MKKSIIEIEDMLNIKYVESLKMGHMGSHILRFIHSKKGQFIVKLALKDDADAQNDLNSNIYGFNKIKEIGALKILPSGLKKLNLLDNNAIIMEDLGSSVSIKNEGIVMFNSVWKNYKKLILKTAIKEKQSTPPLFIKEVINHIEKYAYTKDIFKITDIIKNTNWDINGKEKSSIMLLDFTPDNIFINKNKLSFIDPWLQDTYLGNPAVSIGQFVTLAKLYKMKDSDEAFIFYKNECLHQVPLMLNYSITNTELSFKLGSTLQLILSSYIRRKSDPDKAKKLLSEAEKLWF